MVAAEPMWVKAQCQSQLIIACCTYLWIVHTTVLHTIQTRNFLVFIAPMLYGIGGMMCMCHIYHFWSNFGGLLDCFFISFRFFNCVSDVVAFTLVVAGVLPRIFLLIFVTKKGVECLQKNFYLKQGKEFKTRKK